MTPLDRREPVSLPGLTPPVGDPSSSGTGQHGESMRWCNCTEKGCADLLVAGASAVVAWVNANGGEARYRPVMDLGHGRDRQRFPVRIIVRTRDGEAHCAPGQRVVMGEPFCIHGDDHDGFCRREFTVEDA